MTLDRSRILQALRRRVPIVIRSHLLSPEVEADLEGCLAACLDELGLAPLKDRLAYALRELTGNALKANLKRVYFADKGWNIHDPADYRRGMETFRAESLAAGRQYLGQLVDKGLTVEASFEADDEHLVLEVRNSVAATTEELARVQDRLDRSWTFDSPDQVFDQVLDDTEGAGLGLGILLLTLRKMGLDGQVFSLGVEGATTVARLVLPMEEVRRVRVAELTATLAEAVESLPPFPETIRTLMALLEDPEVSFADLAAALGRDPALTADLLKYLHSAGVGGRRTGTLEDAVRAVGLRAFRDLLLPYGAHRVLAGQLAKHRDLWDDAVAVADLAEALAARTSGLRSDRGRARIAGLLHNLGAIVAHAADPESSAALRAFCLAKGYGPALYEELAQVVPSAALGALIAEKWGFPDDLTAVLRHQDRPAGAPSDVKAVASVVRGATCVRAAHRGWMDLRHVDGPVLEVLGFKGAEELKTWVADRQA